MLKRMPFLTRAAVAAGVPGLGVPAALLEDPPLPEPLAALVRECYEWMLNQQLFIPLPARSISPPLACASVRPERRPWHGPSNRMEHILRPGDHLPFQSCWTARPAAPQPTVTCPCGAVIWDLSTCEWGQTWWGIPIQVSYEAERLDIGETPDSPLPDETLRCCGQEWSTHQAWMEHYRKAHVS